MKRTASLILAALMACALACPALAAEVPEGTAPATGAAKPVPTLFPVEVTEYIEGDHPRLAKTYILTAADNPAAIPTADFVREGHTYTLLDLTRRDNTATDAKLHTEAVTVESKSKDMGKILPLLPTTQEVTTQDGYTGVLTLDTASIKVEAAGYGTSSRTVTATRSYPNLSDADTALVPRTTEDNGRTLTLADVQWQEAGGFYHATATYIGTATNKYATSYTVTANYSGEVSRTTSDAIIYTAIFSGTQLQPVEPVEDGPQAATEDPADRINLKWLLVLPIGAAGVGLAFLIPFLQKKYKSKKEWKEYTK